MRLMQFQTRLDARGPDFECWPPEERAAAQALLAQSEPARRALAEATALDRALSDLPTGPAGPRLRSAILEVPDRQGGSVRSMTGRPAVDGWSPHRRGISLGWTAIAASALIGFSVGLWWPSEPPIWNSEDLVTLVYGMPDFDPDLDEVLR